MEHIYSLEAHQNFGKKIISIEVTTKFAQERHKTITTTFTLSYCHKSFTINTKGLPTKN